jgi:hypothetical protein
MPSTVNANLIPAEGTTGSTNRTVAIDQQPNECPICHYTIQPEYLTGAPIAAASNWLEIYYRCTNQKCRRHFTGLYIKANGSHYDFPNLVFYEFQRSVPIIHVNRKFDPIIEALSPNFVRVITQASAAEAFDLLDVAGPGYRKALEFLVKDYAISLNPTQTNQIKDASLGTVIQQFLTGDKLNVVSSRAAWLGNDETHYERRWIGKNLEDLKRLIGATVHFIEMEKLAAGLPTEMPKPS